MKAIHLLLFLLNILSADIFKARQINIAKVRITRQCHWKISTTLCYHSKAPWNSFQELFHWYDINRIDSNQIEPYSIRYQWKIFVRVCVCVFSKNRVNEIILSLLPIHHINMDCMCTHSHSSSVMHEIRYKLFPYQNNHNSMCHTMCLYIIYTVRVQYSFLCLCVYPMHNSAVTSVHKITSKVVFIMRANQSSIRVSCSLDKTNDVLRHEKPKITANFRRFLFLSPSPSNPPLISTCIHFCKIARQ